jgi:hypothetical protein
VVICVADAASHKLNTVVTVVRFCERKFKPKLSDYSDVVEAVYSITRVFAIRVSTKGMFNCCTALSYHLGHLKLYAGLERVTVSL